MFTKAFTFLWHCLHPRPDSTISHCDSIKRVKIFSSTTNISSLIHQKGPECQVIIGSSYICIYFWIWWKLIICTNGRDWCHWETCEMEPVMAEQLGQTWVTASDDWKPSGRGGSPGPTDVSSTNASLVLVTLRLFTRRRALLRNGCKVVLKLGTSQMMENRLPDARELSYQDLMAGSVNKHSRLTIVLFIGSSAQRREYLWKRPDFSNPRSFILDVPGPGQNVTSGQVAKQVFSH